MTTGTTGVPLRHNPWLDLVRTIAIMLVLVRHGERALHDVKDGPNGLLQIFFTNGWIGVDLFFGLSGYLILRHLLRVCSGDGGFDLRRYLALRALRILPAYYAVLLLVLAGAIPLFDVPEEGLGWRTAYHLLFLQDYLPSDINVVFWSLGAEEKFYLLAPVLALLLLRCKLLGQRLAILVVLLATPTAFRTLVYLSADAPFTYPAFWQAMRSPFHMSFDGFVAGMAVAVLEHARLIRSDRRVGLVLLGGVALLLTLWMASGDFMSRITLVDAALQPPLIALLVGLILYASVQLARMPMPLTRTASVVAKLSYSLYLIHYPLIPLARAISAPFGPSVFWIIYLGLSFGSALILYAVVERPFLKWKDQVAAGSKGVRSLLQPLPSPVRTQE